MVVVKWSACAPYIPTSQVPIRLKPTSFSAYFVMVENKNKQKGGPELTETFLPDSELDRRGCLPETRWPRFGSVSGTGIAAAASERPQ